MPLSPTTIKKSVADSETIYRRGVSIYERGALLRVPLETQGSYLYRYDGDYGDYEITIDRDQDGNHSFDCSCPYPGPGCKHVVAAFLDIANRHFDSPAPEPDAPNEEKYLTYDEIKIQAIKDREKRAKSDGFRLVPGDTFKGEHLVETTSGKSYTVTLHNPVSGKGHCNCPDYTDMTLKMDEAIFIFEFKVVELVKQKNSALEQIKENRYHEKYDTSGEVYLVGVEFSKEDRNIVGFEWKKTGQR